MSQPAGPVVKYVYRCLQLNPAKQAQEILDLRAAALGLPTRLQEGGADAVKKRQARRQKLQQELDSIRSVFWTAPGAHLQTQLSRLDVGDFPELQKGVQRMLQLVGIREQVNSLLGMPNANSNLVNTFKRVMMLPPIEAGRVKDEFLFALPFHADLVSVKSMVRMLIDRLPQVYQVERAWFDQILAAKAGRQYVAGGYHGSQSSGEFALNEVNYSFLVAVCFVLMLVRIIYLSVR